MKTFGKLAEAAETIKTMLLGLLPKMSEKCKIQFPVPPRLVFEFPPLLFSRFIWQIDTLTVLVRGRGQLRLFAFVLPAFYAEQNYPSKERHCHCDNNNRI
jgi:hypothetical protein